MQEKITKLVGYSHVTGSGTIEGKALEWDNVNLHIITNTDARVVGFSAQSQKIKFKDFTVLTGLQCIDDLSQWIDKKIIFNYSLIGAKVVLSSVALAK